MKPYKTHFRKFTLIAVLVAIVVVFWKINILINKYKIKADSESSDNQNQQNSQTKNPYSAADDHSNYSSETESDYYQENSDSYVYKTDDVSSASNDDTTSEQKPETPIETVPEYVVSINLEKCIDDFMEFDLLTKSGFNDLDNETSIATYKGLCDELIYSKPTNSYEFIHERSPNLPEMPYYVEVSGIFLLDNYKVRYE